MLLVASVVFVYYTTWALVLVRGSSPRVPCWLKPASPQPLLPPDNAAHKYFLPREWAVRIPALILLLGLSAVGAFVSTVMIREGRKRRAKEAAAKAQ